MDNKTDSISEMSKCIKCLYIELPAFIAWDADRRWQDVIKEIERLKEIIKSENRLYTIRGGGHNDLSDFEVYDSILKEIFG
ncbi:hypothetical protein LCGC14_2038290 [marine sediment metagenome]|uniref:Uncharacterized protein n=1 Tax=marine sediment metagenome TaxID=412755 RepID=A0A0F9H634_9ZZZZ